MSRNGFVYYAHVEAMYSKRPSPKTIYLPDSYLKYPDNYQNGKQIVTNRIEFLTQHNDVSLFHVFNFH